MVKITNGVSTLVVTRGAYEGIYKSQGYSISGDLAVKPVEKVVEPEQKTDKVNELIEKPISQWTKEEVKEFASKNNIDISGTKNANEAKAIIKKFIDEMN